jgi:nitrous oxide reductase
MSEKVDLGRRRFLGAAAMMIAAAQFNGVDSAKARSEFTPATFLS